jgi:hypothetical protein
MRSGSPGLARREGVVHRLVFPTERDRGNLASRRSGRRRRDGPAARARGEPRRGFRRVLAIRRWPQAIRH